MTESTVSLIGTVRWFLFEEQRHRSDRLGFVTDPIYGQPVPEFSVAERDTALFVVNALREERGKSAVEMACVADAEQCAAGSFGYTDEFALGCARLVQAP